jgi:hypothetical protein
MICMLCCSYTDGSIMYLLRYVISYQKIYDFYAVFFIHRRINNVFIDICNLPSKKIFIARNKCSTGRLSNSLQLTLTNKSLTSWRFSLLQRFYRVVHGLSSVHSDRFEKWFWALVQLLRPDCCPLTGHNPGLLPASLLDITPWEDICT